MTVVLCVIGAAETKKADSALYILFTKIRTARLAVLGRLSPALEELVTFKFRRSATAGGLTSPGHRRWSKRGSA